jgi:rhodanese-related sulfurtransferase
VETGPVLLVFGLFGAFVLWNLWRALAGKVAPAAARDLVAGGALLLDVRTAGEFAAAHLPGAMNVPVQVLEERLGELGHKERPVVLYCASGIRSATAARLLKAAGFHDVHDLGGMSRWPRA